MPRGDFAQSPQLVQAELERRPGLSDPSPAIALPCPPAENPGRAKSLMGGKCREGHRTPSFHRQAQPTVRSIPSGPSKPRAWLSNGRIQVERSPLPYGQPSQCPACPRLL